MMASHETGDAYSANNSRMSVSHAPQPEQVPVALDIPSRSSTPLSMSRLICVLVVPLQRHTMSSLLS